MNFVQFNWLHPIDYIRSERNKLPGIEQMDLSSYTEWLQENDFGMSGAFTAELKRGGHSVTNIFWSDDLYRKKLQSEFSLDMADYKILLKYLTSISIKQLKKLVFLKSVRDQELNAIRLLKFFSKSNFEILLVREPAGIDHQLLQKVKEWYKVKVVCLLGCEFRHITNFNPFIYDAVFTLTPNYESFFRFINPNTHLFKYGLYNYQANRYYKHDVVFVGDLSSIAQKNKAGLMNAIAEQYAFKWWGPTNVDPTEFPHLYRSYQDQTGGKAMIEIYAQSKVVVNDYPAYADGHAVNMRIWEVISAGAFLLTRDSSSLSELKNAGLTVFTSNAECLQLVGEFLNDEEKRETVAIRLKQYCHENHNFEKSIMAMTDKIKNLN